jgi:hypothetical protein
LSWPKKRHFRGKINLFFQNHGRHVVFLAVFYVIMAVVYANGFLGRCDASRNWRLMLTAGASNVLAQCTPLLLLTVLYGSVGWIQRTTFGLAVPLEDLGLNLQNVMLTLFVLIFSFSSINSFARRLRFLRRSAHSYNM